MIPKRQYSNQFPRKQDIEQLPLNERALILFKEIINRKDEKESLYKYINHGK